MRRGRARAALVGAAMVVLVVLTVGGLSRPIGGQTTTSAATTTSQTPTTCLPVAYIVPTPSSRVVTSDAPRIIAREDDNGTEYDVPIETVLNVRLEVRVLAGACNRPSWGALTVGPPDVLRLVSGTDSTEGHGASANFEVVGPGPATISSELLHCVTVHCAWSVSVRASPIALAVSPTSGPPGTVISISGQGCGRTGVATSAIDVVVNLTTTDRQTGFDFAHVATRPDGSWAGTLTVPVGADPSIGYLVNADCSMNGDEALFEYESVPFHVTSLPRTDLPRTG
jgi:hypothetical protein